jgi:cation transport regulator ChaC
MMSEEKGKYAGYTEYLENRIRELERQSSKNQKPAATKKRVKKESIQQESSQVLLNE